MKSKNFVDCFMLMNAALTLSGGKKLSEMGRPEIQEFQTTPVNISVTINYMEFINMDKMHLRVNLLLHQRWIDPRLGANIKTAKMAVSGQIWKPKVTNVNGIVLNDQNKEDTLFWRGFGSKGNILLSEKILIDISCTTNFKDFPFDQQMCLLKFGTYRFPMEEVELIWAVKSVENVKDLILQEFDLESVANYVELEERPSGNYTILVVQFNLQRTSIHYVLCTGLPTILIITISYLTFFFKKQNTSIRCIIIFTCFITTLSIYILSICSHQTPYLRAIDIYNIINTLFIICALLKTFIVDLLYYNNSNKTSYKYEENTECVVWLERSFKIGFLVIYMFCIVIFCMIFLM